MRSEAFEYHLGSDLFEGFLLTHDDGQTRPGLMIFHTWSGLGPFEKDKAELVASWGYNVLAVDLYGKGRRGTTVDESRQLMGELTEDRGLLRRRLLAALSAFQGVSGVDGNKIAAIGFCFGGLCALDLARSGAAVQGVISVHGLFVPPPPSVANGLIKAKVLALHGYEDPMVPPEHLTALATELSNAGVDWQVHAYGLTYHAFTNPAANDAEGGKMFNPVANQRAWQSMENFLHELFQ